MIKKKKCNLLQSQLTKFLIFFQIQVFSLNKIRETLYQTIQFISRHDKRSMYRYIDI